MTKQKITLGCSAEALGLAAATFLALATFGVDGALATADMMRLEMMVTSFESELNATMTLRIENNVSNDDEVARASLFIPLRHSLRGPPFNIFKLTIFLCFLFPEKVIFELEIFMIRSKFWS